jgi:hypothetical protein
MPSWRFLGSKKVWKRDWAEYDARQNRRRMQEKKTKKKPDDEESKGIISMKAVSRMRTATIATTTTTTTTSTRTTTATPVASGQVHLPMHHCLWTKNFWPLHG